MSMGGFGGAVLDVSNVNSERGDVLSFWVSVPVGFACTGWRIHRGYPAVGGGVQTPAQGLAGLGEGVRARPRDTPPPPP